ncbi:MAG TPA: GlsB/YeaQ/YmgE family stress response membrane protein [Pirellulales bacterium]|jgi:uncharacterized membrane protein YeaQ/YmgE (transglycosylase-associated protein family)|nr:GlsB/YeaQ/YmgE family stress response membrane protein [Pirellulales bacterium]
MWIVKLLLFGLAVGLLARLLHPGRDRMNLLWTMLLGVWGSILGGWVGTLLGINVEEGWRHWVAATLGAVFLLLLYGALIRKPVDRTADGAERRRFGVFRRRPS